MIGTGITIWGNGNPVPVLTFGAIGTLYVGVSATITVTALNAEGQTAVITVDGETWGSGTVSGGSVAVTATPTSAMEGAGVAVVATVGGTTASTTADVLVRSITFDALPDIYVATGTGITYAITGTTANVPDGTTITITVNGQAWGSGTVTSNAFSVAATPSDAMANLTAAVVATVPGATKTGSIRCVGPSLFAGLMLDLRRKVDYSLAPSIQTWGNQSGGNYDVSAPAEANQPADGATGPDFSGDADPDADYLLNSDLGNAIGTVSDLYVAVAFRADVTSGNDGILYLGQFLGGEGTLQLFLVSNYISAQTIGIADPPYTAFTDTAAFHVLDFQLVSGVGTPAIDGVGFGTMASGALALDGLKIVLCAYYNSSYAFNGVIANVLISTDSTAGNVALMREWLTAVKP